MIVLSLTDCPPALRGELTRWLLEIHTGVYVGHVSARVRDRIWERVQEHAKSGRATMVFSTGKGEQRLDFYTHQSDWEPVDFDGLKLVLRPSAQRLSQTKTPQAPLAGYSKAARMRKAKQMSRRRRAVETGWTHYAVIDLETTGLSASQDEIIELGAIIVRDDQVVATYEALVTIEGKLPDKVTKLTGITEDDLRKTGKLPAVALAEFFAFLEDFPVVAHHGDFDYAFLRSACSKYDFPLFSNQYEDTMPLAKRYVNQVGNYKLETLVEHLGISVSRMHRSLNDCFATMQLYMKLNEIRQQTEIE